MSRAASAAAAVPAAPQRPKLNAIGAAHRASIAEQSDKARQRAADAAAFDRMCEARPLKPPPMPVQPELMSAARRALARDRRLGAWRDARYFGGRS